MSAHGPGALQITEAGCQQHRCGLDSEDAATVLVSHLYDDRAIRELHLRRLRRPTPSISSVPNVQFGSRTDLLP